MEIENAKGIFDLGDDKITVERTNPLLNDQGSLSLTYPIKRTAKNDYLLGFPHKYSRKAKYEIKTDVNIRAGLLNENATLQMTSVDSDQVEATFLLYESTFYSRIQEVKLPTVFEGVERWFDSSSVPVATRVANIVSMVKSMILSKSNLTEDFTAFPVISSCEWESSTELFAKADKQNIINEIYWNNEPASGGNAKFLFRPETEYTFNDSDGNNITVPVGFGCSIFLRYGYVLRKIFQYFGFSLEENLFDYGHKYRRVVCINNTQDAIMRGYLVESQLVPDITVNDFLDFVRESFNADFFIDVPSKKVRLVFFDDMLSSEPDMDLSHYLTSPEEIEYADARQVKLAVGTNLENGSIPCDTLSELKNKYGNLYSIGSVRGNSNGVHHFDLYNQVWKETLLNPTTHKYQRTYLGSMNFMYSPTGNLETEEHESPANLPAIIQYDFNVGCAQIGSFRRMNTSLVMNGSANSEEKVECPFILAIETWDGKRMAVVTEADESGNTLYYPTNPYPDLISLHTWGNNGLFAKFWQNYDQLLRKSWHTVTAPFRIPAKVLQSWDFTRLKLIDGQPMIANKLTYELTDDPVVDVEIELKTAKIYE